MILWSGSALLRSLIVIIDLVIEPFEVGGILKKYQDNSVDKFLGVETLFFFGSRDTRSVVANVFEDIVFSEIELQSRYYVPFWTYIPGKDMNPVFPHSGKGSITPLLFFYKDTFGIK